MDDVKLNCFGEPIKGRYYSAEFYKKMTGVDPLPIMKFISDRKGKTKEKHYGI